jgi:hypothetical protein
MSWCPVDVGHYTSCCEEQHTLGNVMDMSFLLVIAILPLYSVSQCFTFVSIQSSMTLQPFVGPWPFLQFRDLLYTDGKTPWTGDQPVARPLPTHRTTQTQNKRTQSWIRTHDPSVRASEDSSCLRPRGHRIGSDTSALEKTY